MTTTAEETIFAPEAYDLEGTPTLNRTKATSIKLAFDTFELDHTDAQHMLLAGMLEGDETITITVTARPTGRGWVERPDAETDRVGRRYTLTIRDIGT